MFFLLLTFTDHRELVFFLAANRLYWLGDRLVASLAQVGLIFLKDLGRLLVCWILLGSLYLGLLLVIML